MPRAPAMCLAHPRPALPHFSRPPQDLKAAFPELGRGLQQLLDFDGDVEAVFCRRCVLAMGRGLSQWVFGGLLDQEHPPTPPAVTFSYPLPQLYS